MTRPCGSHYQDVRRSHNAMMPLIIRSYHVILYSFFSSLKVWIRSCTIRYAVVWFYITLVRSCVVISQFGNVQMVELVQLHMFCTTVCHDVITTSYPLLLWLLFVFCGVPLHQVAVSSVTSLYMRPYQQTAWLCMTSETASKYYHKYWINVRQGFHHSLVTIC